MMRYRILYLVTDHALGGTPRMVESLVLGLDRTRFEPGVVTLLSASPITDNLVRSGVPTWALDLRSRIDLARLVPLLSIARRFGPHLVHSFLFHANLLARLIGRLAGARAIVTSERGIEVGKGALRSLTDRLTHRLGHALTANAMAVRDAMVRRDGIGPERVRVIPNGIDTARFAPPPVPPPPPLTIAVVARLVPLKGHLDLLAILPDIAAGSGPLRVLVAGEGPMEPVIREAAARLGPRVAVDLEGAVLDVPGLLARAHVFCLPSHEEGMPGSVLEAQAMGLPVVATAVGGTGEVVEHGVTGLLVPPRDPGALRQALASLLADEGRRASMGRAARSRVVERFALPRFVDAHQRLYDELLATGPAR